MIQSNSPSNLLSPGNIFKDKCAPAVRAAAHFSGYFNMYKASMPKIKESLPQEGIWSQRASNISTSEKKVMSNDPILTD